MSLPAHKTLTSFQRQRGVITIFMAISMVALLAISGLGIDLGYAFLHKTKLQNLVDSLALAGAKRIDESGNRNLAVAAVTTLFTNNENLPGNESYANKVDAADLIIEFSPTLYPFSPSANHDPYVRVSINSLSLQSWFVRVLGVNEIELSASAVAGPSPTQSGQLCDATPVMVCGDINEDPVLNGGSSFWGYVPGVVQILKGASDSQGNGNGNGDSEGCIGPGNFQLVRLEGNSGANDLRYAMAGGYDGCVDLSVPIQTEPGNTVGPTASGLNTRFGVYSGPLHGSQNIYPPDVVVTELADEVSLPEGSCVGGSSADYSYNYADYRAQVFNQDLDNFPPQGVHERRVLRVPVGYCDSVTHNGGQTSVPYLGTACFFLLKKVPHTGNESIIYAEFIAGCTQDGPFGPVPEDGYGPYKIVLYEDPGSLDS